MHTTARPPAARIPAALPPGLVRLFTAALVLGALVLAACVLAALGGGPAQAMGQAQTEGKEGPPPGYFAGTYEVIGRVPGATGEPLSDWLQISARDGQMVLHACRAGNGGLAFNTSTREGAAPLVGSLGDWMLRCHYTNDSNNYPRLTCYAVHEGMDAVPGLLALWPVGWEKPAHAADCE